MLTDERLEQLRYEGERYHLDQTSERLTFVRASDDDKSELLKGILGLSNTRGDGTACIHFGFKDNVPHPADVAGLSGKGVIDDSRPQQFVNEKPGRTSYGIDNE